MYRIGWENSNIVLLRIPHPSGPGLGPGLGLGLAPAAAACSFPGFSFGQEILLFTRYFWSYGATFRFSKRVKVGTGTEPRGLDPFPLSKHTGKSGETDYLGVGIFPEKGITKKTRSRVRAHKLTVYGHVFPILVSTSAISKTAVRSRSSRRTLPPLPSNPSSLLLKVVEDARDVGDEAVYMACQVLSYSSATSTFQIKWTDGTASALV